MLFQRAFGAVGGVHAYPVENRSPADGGIRVLHQEFQYSAFRPGQPYLFAAHLCGEGVAVEHQFPETQLFSTFI